MCVSPLLSTCFVLTQSLWTSLPRLLSFRVLLSTPEGKLLSEGGSVLSDFFNLCGNSFLHMILSERKRRSVFAPFPWECEGDFVNQSTVDELLAQAVVNSLSLSCEGKRISVCLQYSNLFSRFMKTICGYFCFLVLR